MFELTRREQALVAGLVSIFLLGLGAMQWRAAGTLQKPLPVPSAR